MRARSARNHQPARRVQRLVRLLGLRGDERLGRHAYIPADLSEQYGRQITPAVHRDSRDTSIRVAKLLVRATLPNFDEP